MDEQINLTGVQKTSSFSTKSISSFLVVVLCFLLPIFFIPSQTFSFLAGKEMVLIFITFLLLLLGVFERIRNKDFSFSKNLIVISTILVPFSYLLSSLFSGSIKLTMLGNGFGVNSFTTILTLFLLMFLVANVVQTKKEVIYLYVSLLFSSIFMFLFHVLRLIFGPEFLSMGVLGTTTANLVGTWNELGIFFGLIAILSLLTIVLIKGNKVIKVASYITLVMTLLFVALVNFFSIWLIISILSLALIVYNLLVNKTPEGKIEKKGISMTSVVVFVISLMFIFAKGPVGGFLPSLFNISNFEVRPSVGATVDIAQATLAQDLVLGAGPNEFTKQWAANKPLEINSSQFWNIEFNSGASFVLTTIVNVGLLGFLAWLLFLGTIIYLGVKLFRISHQSKFNHYISVSVFLATVYLWFFSFVYVPSIVIFSLSFIFTGILLSLLYQDKIIKIRKVSFSDSLGKNIVLTVILVGVLLGYSFGGYLFIKKMMASVKFNQGLVAINVNQDFGGGYQSIVNAANKYPTDLYFRSITDLNLMQLQNILNQEDIGEEELQQQFQEIFSVTVGSAQMAVQLDQKNYLNWANLAKVYGTVTPLGVEGAYDQAIQIYSEAIRLNPNNPSLVLNLANLEIANGDIEKAKEYIMISIQMKNNYSEAYYLLSQIELETGNETEAIRIIEALAQATPNDSEVFLQLGFFKYNVQNYEEAIPLLEQAVNLNPNSLDAVYLLGMSYDGVGRGEEAINIFSYLSQVIPDDNNIITILENLNNGRDPLFGIGQQQPIEIPAIEPTIEGDIPLELDLESGENMEVD